MKKLLVVLLACCLVKCSFASVDSIFIYSNSMHRNIKTFVIRPAMFKKSYPVPVLYLLHGAFGNSSNWIRKVPELEKMATQYQMMIVCPDGSPNSWYWDSPADSAFRFETFISKELPSYIDKTYMTFTDRKHRAIAGLSMGGYGAMFIAFRHAETFGACGSMSGAFDIETLKTSYDISKRLGDTLTNAHYYSDWSMKNIVTQYPKDSLAIIFDCGLQDPFSSMNKTVHQKMLDLNIPHDYTERPGKHDWKYWANAVRYQVLFFAEFFRKGS